MSEGVVSNCGGNLKLALLKASLAQFQAKYRLVSCLIFRDNLDFENKCANIAGKILDDQSIKTLVEIRSIIFQMVSICIPPEDIIECILYELMKSVPSKTSCRLAQKASEIISRLDSSSKAVFHIEAFVAKIMSDIASHK